MDQKTAELRIRAAQVFARYLELRAESEKLCSLLAETMKRNMWSREEHELVMQDTFASEARANLRIFGHLLDSDISD